MESTRLPGKALIEIEGRSVLEWVILRAQKARFLSRVLLAVSDRHEDYPLAQVANRLGVPVVRGESENVLQRFVKALTLYPAKAVVRITGDNPLTDPMTLDQVIGRLHDYSLDYVYAAGTPYGLGGDAFSACLLKELGKHKQCARHQEHINTFFLENYLRYRIGCVSPATELYRPDVHVTLDTSDDLERLKALFSILANPLESSVGEIISAYDCLPESLKAPIDEAVRVALVKCFERS